MIEVWRGAVNAWECDEMGHMNVRFYLARLQEGIGGLAAAAGLEDAFSPSGVSTLLLRELHVRYLREAHAGAPLHMEAGILDASATDVLALAVLRHSRNGEPCAAFVVRLAHVTASDACAFTWSARTREALRALRVELPEFAEPRSVSPLTALDQPLSSPASRELADDLQLAVTARGLVSPLDCDCHGRLRADAVMGRFSDGAAHLFDYMRSEGGRRIGGAMLECRMLFHRTARAGARLELRSGLVDGGRKVERVVHWLLGGDGQPIVTAQVSSAPFDLDARRIADLPADVAAARRARSLSTLTP